MAWHEIDGGSAPGEKLATPGATSRAGAPTSITTLRAEAEIRAIAACYLPGSDVDAYVAQYPALRTIVEITPTSSRVWERGDESWRCPAQPLLGVHP